jgi:hypothetical protein
MLTRIPSILASRAGIWFCNSLSAAVLTLATCFLAHTQVDAVLNWIGINGTVFWVFIYVALIFVIRMIRLEVILVAFITFLLSLFTIGTMVWLVLLAGCVGLYVAALFVLPILAKSKEAGNRSEGFSKLIELLEHRSEISYGDCNIMTQIAEIAAFNEIGDIGLTRGQNLLRFGVAINAVPPSTTELPPELVFIASKKLLYELHNKCGETLPFYKAVVSLSMRDVLRRLDESEIPAFYEFCKNHPLCAQPNRRERLHFFQSSCGSSIFKTILERTICGTLILALWMFIFWRCPVVGRGSTPVWCVPRP